MTSPIDDEVLVRLLRETDPALFRTGPAPVREYLTVPAATRTVAWALSKADFDLAVSTAFARFGWHRDQNTPQTHNREQDPLDPDVGRDIRDEFWWIGAEIAAARVTGREWVDRGSVEADREEGDLGDGIGVRATHWRTGGLRIQEKDKDDHFMILVRGRVPENGPKRFHPLYEVAGWMPVALCKDAVKYPGPYPDRPMFRVPQREIHGMDEPIIRVS